MTSRLLAQDGSDPVNDVNGTAGITSYYRASLTPANAVAHYPNLRKR